MSADESRTVRPLRQNFIGEVFGKSPVVERRVVSTLDGRKCDATKACRLGCDGVQYRSRVSARLGASY